MLEHYKAPKNKFAMKDYDIHKHDDNPVCGDKVDVYIKLNENVDASHRKIDKMSFEGEGCVMCMATASILTEELVGKNVDEIKNFDTNYILKLLNLKLTPTRIKCAMLSLVAVKKGIFEYESKA